METLTIILSLILLVFGILQIILFFKVWGMTNDIRKIRNRFMPDIAREILKNNPNLSDTLFNALYEDLWNAWDSGVWELKPIIDRYKDVYRKVGIEFPSVFEKVETSTDFRNLMSLKNKE